MANYARVTLTDIQGFLAERVGNNTVFWPAAQATEAINHALRVWQALTGEWSIHTITVAGNGLHIYDIPTTGYAPFRVSYGGAPLSFTSIDELDFGSPDWESYVTGTPLYWGHVGATRFFVSPAPASGNMTLECFQDTPVLAAGGDFVQMDDSDLEKLLAYAHHVMTFKEGSSEIEATKDALTALIEAAARRNSALRDTNFYRSVGRASLSVAPTSTLGVRGG